LELGISGDHVFLNKKLTDGLLKYFNLTGYPSYVFIDKEGNYDPDFISRISSIKLNKLKERL